MKKIIYLFVISLAFISCQKEQKIEPKIVPAEVTAKQEPKNDQSGIVLSDSPKNTEEKQTKTKELEVPKPVITAKPLTPEELVEFLPNVRGAEKLPPSKGKQTYDNRYWTTVSTDYRYKGGSGVQVFVNDYYKADNFPTGELDLFKQLPNEPGYNVSAVKNEFGKGFKVMDLNNENGYIYFLINNRFTIRVEGYNLSKSIDIQNIFNQMNLKKLSSIK